MKKSKVFVGLGGNIGDSKTILESACCMLQAIPQISQFRVSRFYHTSAVGSIPQRDYVNAVCCFVTSLGPYELLHTVQEIEKRLGKVPKEKQAPRVIDLDILLFGQEMHSTTELQLPHPHWQERLFVLKPMSDLVQRLKIPVNHEESLLFDLSHFLETFPNLNRERVTVMQN